MPNEEINAAFAIIQLYEKILKEKQAPFLLSHLITLNNDKYNQPLSVEKLIGPNALHLGQMGFCFFLLRREKVYTLFCNQRIKNLPLTDRFGTGKTTLASEHRSQYGGRVCNKRRKKPSPLSLPVLPTIKAVTNNIDSFLKSST